MGNQAAALRPELIDDLSESTAFSGHEIRDYYKRFMKECSDGRMSLSLDEFKKIYLEFFPQGNASKFAEHVFRSFDVDGNGRLDFREFLIGLSVQLKGDVNHKLEWAFNLYDIDGTGKISKQELIEMIKSIHNIHSGQLPREDKVTPEELAEHIFAKADKDGDNSLSKEEFVNNAMSSNTMQLMLKGTMTVSSAALKDVGKK